MDSYDMEYLKKRLQEGLDDPELYEKVSKTLDKIRDVKQIYDPPLKLASVSEKVRPIFKTVLNGKPAQVYQVSDFHNAHGIRNGCISTWWIDDGNGDLYPWIDKEHRPCWSVQIEECNRTKFKWGELSIRSGAHLVLLMNQEVVYSTRSLSMETALVKTRQLMEEICEITGGLSPKSLVGKKVWYYRQAGVIARVDDDGRVVIERDAPGGFDLRQPWNYPVGHGMHISDEWHGEKQVHTDLLDKNIYWHRNKDDVGEEGCAGKDIEDPETLISEVKAVREWNAVLERRLEELGHPMSAPTQTEQPVNLVLDEQEKARAWYEALSTSEYHSYYTTEAQKDGIPVWVVIEAYTVAVENGDTLEPENQEGVRGEGSTEIGAIVDFYRKALKANEAQGAEVEKKITT